MLVDDEQKNLNVLHRLLEENCSQVEIAGEANGFQQAIDLIDTLRPQLLFLDIEMPYGNGFDLLEKITLTDCETIFVTAFDAYALKAFRYNALDYLLKPISIEDLKKAVEKADKRIQEKNISARLNNIEGNIKKTSHQRIGLPSMEGLIFIETADILYLQARGAYTEVYMKNKQVHTVSRTIGDFQENLPAQFFFRVHHSFLVNLSNIKKYNKGRGGFIIMDNDVAIEVSARRRDEFLSIFRL